MNLAISSSYILVIDNFLEGVLELQFDIDLDSMILLSFDTFASVALRLFLQHCPN